MEKRKKYIEETAEKETVRLFNNSLLHPEFKYGFILGMTHADKVPFIKNHKVYDTISKDVINRACEWLKENIDLYSYNAFNTKSGYPEITLTDEFETAFRQAMEE